MSGHKHPTGHKQTGCWILLPQLSLPMPQEMRGAAPSTIFHHQTGFCTPLLPEVDMCDWLPKSQSFRIGWQREYVTFSSSLVGHGSTPLGGGISLQNKKGFKCWAAKKKNGFSTTARVETPKERKSRALR